MIVIVAFVLVLLTVPLANGRLSLIADLKVIALWSVFAALFIQIGIINIFGEKIPEAVAQVVHLGTYALASWFLIANRRIHGLMTIGIGAALNLVAISANNGVMPASPAAASSAGLAHSAEKFANSAPNTL